VAEESYWKVGGGVVLGGLAGVGAIALSPFFGGALVLTGIGAAVGSLVGGGVGGTVAYVTDDAEAQETAMEAAKETGRNEVKAEFAIIIKGLKLEIAQHKLHALQQYQFDDLTLAMYGIGIAALMHCRAADPNNMRDLKDFVFGSAHANLPPATLAGIANIEGSTPTLAGTYARAHKVAPNARELFEMMVDFVAMMFDTTGKHGLTSIWSQLRAA
jgi:hypothetical protein